jgi:hypothetical protein
MVWLLRPLGEGAYLFIGDHGEGHEGRFRGIFFDSGTELPLSVSLILDNIDISVK